MKDCKTIRRALDAHRTGELRPPAFRAVEQHLGSCRECTARLEEFRTLAARSVALRVPAPETILAVVEERAGDHFDQVETAVGPLWVAFNARGISMVLPAAGPAAGFIQSYGTRRGRKVAKGEIPESYAAWVRRAAAGNPPPTPKIDLGGLPEFERRVLTLLRRIPRGEVRPYSWLAREAGRPAAARAVGNSMARNPVPLLIPCHRVVKADGGIGNYAFGSEMKRELLRREGAPVDELERLAREGVRFMGCTSTRIYCLPACRHLRRARPERREPFASAHEAIESGYRPCRHCRPEPAAA